MNERERLGGKGEGLVWLVDNQDLGFGVPSFGVVETPFNDLIEKQVEVARLASILTRKPYEITGLPKPVEVEVERVSSEVPGTDKIVRSSSVLEDGKHSFAGIYHSEPVENATPALVKGATRRVYDSMNAPRALEYRKEHGLGSDKMAIVVQQFVEPDWAGVMYTSNPSYPRSLSIEFCRGRNKVVDGNAETFIIDFDKKTGKPIFQSEDFPDKTFNLENLFIIGKGIEARSEPSDIEFLIKGDSVSLVQKRRITDLSEPVDIKIPKYKADQLIGKTRVCRGTGKVTLPAFVTESFGDMVDSYSLIGSLQPGLMAEQIKSYFDRLLAFDKQFKMGYALVIPHFDGSVIQQFRAFTSDGRAPTIDNLTPNKKAVITTCGASISSHVMTVAREKGIAYAGINFVEKEKDRLKTGDVVSIYFRDGEASVYREQSQLMGLRQRFPDVQINDVSSHGFTRFRVGWDIGAYERITEDVNVFLNSELGESWKFKPHGNVMGGIFKNKNGQDLEVAIMKIHGEYYEWCIHPANPGLSRKRVPEAEAQRIADLYKKSRIR